MPDLVDTLNRFPPSFDDNAWIYGGALFMLTLMSALSASALIGQGLEARHRARINHELGNMVTVRGLGLVTLLSLYRFKEAMLLLTVFQGTSPDAITLLLWGEASDSTMYILFTVDRVFDMTAGCSFLLWVTAKTLSGGSIAHRLALDPDIINVRPRWYRVKDNLKIALYAFLIAVGVTLYKATV